MHLLFVHQHGPGQYEHLARHLARDKKNRVEFLAQTMARAIPGVHTTLYTPPPWALSPGHPYLTEFQRAVTVGVAAAEACRQLSRDGFRPDIIIGHSGWGETLYLREVFPNVPLLANFEFYYHPRGADLGFDPEFETLFNDPAHLQTRNATTLLAFSAADWGHTATHWQYSLHPAFMQSQLSVLHEGIDTEQLRPNTAASFKLASGRVLTRHDQVVTYVARNLEPYRGFHTFMRALPAVLRRHRRAEVVIVGGDEVSYGSPPPPGRTFRETLLEELDGQINPKRVHFVGRVSHARYRQLLALSSAHVYLTYPFVLSWSFLEALSTGCLVVGSSTPPVLEVLKDGVNGLSVDFLSPESIAAGIQRALAGGKDLQALRQAARATAVAHFDLRRCILPRWQQLLNDLVAGRTPDREC